MSDLLPQSLREMSIPAYLSMFAVVRIIGDTLAIRFGGAL
jgi:hypothetical protein